MKSNIGHLEAAAGIAAVTKVLLQLRHGELVPSLHADVPNPHIAFAATPFQVQRSLEAWPCDAVNPRRAGISSFGAGGANAHVVVEEWRDRTPATEAASPVAIVLSARDPVALSELARKIALHLEGNGNEGLHDIAFTLQVGRTPMDVRLGMVVTEASDAAYRLREWADAQLAAPLRVTTGLSPVTSARCRRTPSAWWTERPVGRSSPS